MFSSSLLVEETKEKKNQDDDNRIKGGNYFEVVAAKTLKLLHFQLGFRHI